MLDVANLATDFSRARIFDYTHPGFFTWAKPRNATLVCIMLVGAGGGGGGGCGGTSATVCGGGGGGAGGARVMGIYPAVFLPDTLRISVAPGRPGGAGGVNAAGSAGTPSGSYYTDSRIQTIVRNNTIVDVMFAGTGGSGNGGTTTAGGSAGGSSSGTANGFPGKYTPVGVGAQTATAGGGATAPTNVSWTPNLFDAGGGGGGCVITTPAVQAGGNGSMHSPFGTSVPGGSTEGARGLSWFDYNLSSVVPYACVSGGGGASSITNGVPGGNGGDGIWGGGGGGGGACSATGTPTGGRGGRGGDGYCFIVVL